MSQENTYFNIVFQHCKKIVSALTSKKSDRLDFASYSN